MSELETGGPAFPTESEAQTGARTWRYEGMSLRDHFAAKALAGMIAQPGKDLCGKSAVPKLAQFAYEYADAMLKARQQEQS